MKCKLAGREVELDIEGRVRSGVIEHARTGMQVSRTSGAARLTTNRKAERSRVRTSGDGSIPSSAPPSPYKSKWEVSYANYLDALKLAGEIVGWWYEPVRFRLPGTRNFYKADFLVHVRCKQASGSVAGQHAGIEIHEVKGWSKNRREGITKLKTAAGLNTWATFYLVQWDRKRRVWDKQLVNV